MTTVLGIDPGAVWTGLAVRKGDECLDASTIGRVALSNPDDDIAYIDRLRDMIDSLILMHTPTEFHVETMRWPSKYVHGEQQTDRERLRVGFYLAQSCITYGAVIGALTPVTLIAPADHEHGTFPKNFRGKRPAHFSTNDHPRNDRRHEKAAYSIAGAQK